MSSNVSSSADRLLFKLQKSPVNFKQLQQIHAQIVTNTSLQSNSFVSNFISSCARCNKFDYASNVLKNLQSLDSSLWNLMLRFSLESNLDREFLCVYKKLIQTNTRPDKVTYLLILRGCAAFSAINFGKSVHCQVLKMGHEIDLFLNTGLLDYYSKIGCLGFAKKVFDEMPERDVIAHNAMITAFSNGGDLANAKYLFDKMPERNTVSWNCMISSFCKAGDIQSARTIFDQCLVKDVISWNSMIDGYCKSSQLEAAWVLFNQMDSAKNSVTWNTMITGFVQCREFGRAVSMFQEMQVENVKPTEVTMVSLLSACAHLGALDMGRWIHAYIRHYKLSLDVVLGNALIDMYSKCGHIETALEVFHGLPVKNVYCWNSIIVGLGMHGHGKEAIDVFLEMQKGTIRPDGVTFVGLLCGCSHSGLVSEGRLYFSQMHGVYGVEPGIEHYGCLIDLLGRAGFLYDALKLIETMPIKPNCIVWGSLLRACKVHRNTKLSEQVTQHLLELDPRDGGNYVFLSNVYASVNRWNDVENCRKLMMEKGVQKLPGCSSIEVDNVVHEFVAGDTSHPQFTQIYAFLDEIGMKLRDLGHKPDTSPVLHDIEDEEKENAVRYHSEKIAIAFGLLSIGQGKPIRVVKNLRICSDCHESTKLIAKLFTRDIIVRDRNRFHHFRDGLCSCHDYW